MSKCGVSAARRVYDDEQLSSLRCLSPNTIPKVVFARQLTAGQRPGHEFNHERNGRSLVAAEGVECSSRQDGMRIGGRPSGAIHSSPWRKRGVRKRVKSNLTIGHNACRLIDNE